MQNQEIFKNIAFLLFLKGFGGPRGSQNAPKSVQNRFRRPLGASWGSLGALLASLGASWAALGASGGLLEALLAALRALLWPLGQLLGPLGPLLAALGVVLGAPGALLGSMLASGGGSFWSCLGLFLKLPCKLVKVSKSIVFYVFWRFSRSQGVPKTPQNRFRRPLGASWGSLGALLAPLGRLLAPLRPSGALWGRSWSQSRECQGGSGLFRVPSGGGNQRNSAAN